MAERPPSSFLPAGLALLFSLCGVNGPQCAPLTSPGLSLCLLADPPPWTLRAQAVEPSSLKPLGSSGGRCEGPAGAGAPIRGWGSDQRPRAHQLIAEPAPCFSPRRPFAFLIPRNSLWDGDCDIYRHTRHDVAPRSGHCSGPRGCSCEHSLWVWDTGYK